MLENLKRLREEASVSQKQLAEAVGVSQQSINKYENHNIEPDIGTLIRIAEYFNTSVDYVVGHSAIRRKIEAVVPYELNAGEAALVEGYRRLTQTQQNCVQTVIKSYEREP